MLEPRRVCVFPLKAFRGTLELCFHYVREANLQKVYP